MPVTDLNAPGSRCHLSAHVRDSKGIGACTQAGSFLLKYWTLFPGISSGVVSSATAAISISSALPARINTAAWPLFAQLTRHESLRDMEACLRAQQSKLYHRGIRAPISRSTLALGQRATRLAYRRRFGPSTHPDRPQASCRRQHWGRTRQHRLCPRRLDHRPLPVGLSLGTFSPNQSGGQTPHPARSAGQHPDIHTYLRGQASRGQCARSADPRARGVLPHGPWLSGFRPALPAYPRQRFFRDPRQTELPVPPPPRSAS